MRLLLKVINDFRTLKRRQIGLKYVIPFALIIFLWGTIGFTYMTTVKKSELITIKGFVTMISFESRKNGDNLLLLINGTTYRLLNHGYDMNVFAEKVSRDRFVELLVRKPFQHILSLGKRNDVMEIKQNSNMIFSYETMQRHYRNLAFLSVTVSIIFITILIIYRKQY